MPRLDSLAALEAASLGWYFDPVLAVYAKFDALGCENQLALVYS